jgi:hypothetical protein
MGLRPTAGSKRSSSRRVFSRIHGSSAAIALGVDVFEASRWM